MEQISFDKNILTLNVKKISIFGRSILYAVTFLLVIPVIGIIYNIISGDGLKFISVIGLMIFGIISFYMLRISLWNTFGTEVIKIDKNKLNYMADYNWFRDKIKNFDFENIHFDSKSIGYEEDNKAVLLIKFDNKDVLETVTKVDVETLNEWVDTLNTNFRQS